MAWARLRHLRVAPANWPTATSTIRSATSRPQPGPSESLPVHGPRVRFRDWTVLLPRQILRAGERAVSERGPDSVPGGINFYAYVRNNPVGLRDPKGLCVDQDKLKNCISSLFGVATLFFTPSTPDANGSFTGEMAGIYNGAYQPLLPGPYEFTVTNNTGLTVSSVTALYHPAGFCAGPTGDPDWRIYPAEQPIH